MNSLLILMKTDKILVILSTEAGSYADTFFYIIGLRNRRLNEQSSTPCWSEVYKNKNNIITYNECPPKKK
jgi:hypothetical protein